MYSSLQCLSNNIFIFSQIVLHIVSLQSLFSISRDKAGKWATGADPGFQVRGGEYLKKLRRAEEGANILGVFRVTNHYFTPKNHSFYNYGGRREQFWGISCEKSRFYAKKTYFFPILGGGRAPGAPPPPGSAPELPINIQLQHVKKYYNFMWNQWQNLRCIYIYMKVWRYQRGNEKP